MKVGDRVKVTDPDILYSSYDDLAVAIGATLWKENKHVEQGQVGRIVAMGMHEYDTNKKIALVRTKDEMGTIYEVLMGIEGLKVLHSKPDKKIKVIL